MFKKILNPLVVFILSAGLIFSSFALDAFADETPSTWLQISPVSVRFSLDPGEVVEKNFEVKNIGADAFSFRVYAKPYSAADKTYSLDFETETVYAQISRWISFKNLDGDFVEETSFSLNPDEAIDITYKIETPPDVAAGGQYASLFAEVIPQEAEISGFQTISRAGLLVYANIAGETRRGVKISDVSATRFLTSGNMGVSATIENIGNIDLQTSVNLSISSLSGKELFNDYSALSVFPETSRIITSEWKETPLFGLYRLSYTISALDTKTSASQIVLIMPAPLLFFSLALIATMIILVVIYCLKRRSKK